MASFNVEVSAYFCFKTYGRNLFRWLDSVFPGGVGGVNSGYAKAVSSAEPLVFLNLPCREKADEASKGAEIQLKGKKKLVLLLKVHLR